MKCECCGQTIRTPKAKATTPAKPLADMTTAELYAHYKKTAPLDDVRFFSATATMSDALRVKVDALLVCAPSMNRADIYRQLVNLQGTWRQESNVRERIERLTEQKARIEAELMKSAAEADKVVAA